MRGGSFVYYRPPQKTIRKILSLIWIREQPLMISWFRGKKSVDLGFHRSPIPRYKYTINAGLITQILIQALSLDRCDIQFQSITVSISGRSFTSQVSCPHIVRSLIKCCLYNSLNKKVPLGLRWSQSIAKSFFKGYLLLWKEVWLGKVTKSNPRCLLFMVWFTSIILSLTCSVSK